MKRRSRRIVAAIATALLTTGASSGVHAQSVVVQARIPADVANIVAEIDHAIHEALGPDLAREIRDALRDVEDAVRDATVFDATDVSRTVKGALRGLEHARAAGWLDDQSRDFHAQQVDRQTQALAIGANGQLTLTNVVGATTITAGTGNTATIEIVRTSRGRTDADAKAGLERVHVDVTDRSGRATVKTVYPNDTRASYRVNVDFIVTIPAGTEVVASAVSGDISVQGVHGDLSVTTVSGNVTIGKSGSISDAHTISGNITITGAETDGSIVAGVTSGRVLLQQSKAHHIALDSISDDVTADGVTCDTATLHSLSGNLVYNGTLSPHGRYDLQTHSGSVRLQLDGRTGFELDARTFSGTIRSDLPITAAGVTTHILRHAMHGTFGDGSASISVVTFSGNVVLSKKP